MYKNLNRRDFIFEFFDDECDYVSDFLKFEAQNWPLGMNVFISCGTGTGKTTFAKNLSTLTGGRTLILSNRVANLKQTRKDGNFWKSGINLFGDCCISYQKLESNPKLDVNWLNTFTHIVVDEAHYFVKDAGFNAKANISIAKIIASRCTKIFMSATIDEFQTVYVRLLNHLNQFNFFNNVRYSMTKSKLFIESVEEIINESQIPKILRELHGKTLIFVDSIEKGRKLKDELAPFFSVGMITSESKESEEIKEKDLFNTLIEKEKFDTDILIATSVIDNGVNIKDDNLKNIIIQNADKDEIIQMIGRKRCINKADKVRVFLVSSSEQSLSKKIEGLEEQKQLFEQTSRDLLAYQKPHMWFLDESAFGRAYRSSIYYMPEFNALFANYFGYQSIKIQLNYLYELKKENSQFETKLKWIKDAVCNCPNQSSNQSKNSFFVKEMEMFVDEDLSERKKRDQFRKYFTRVFYKTFGIDKAENQRSNRDLSIAKIKFALEKNAVPLVLSEVDGILRLQKKHQHMNESKI